MHFFFYITITIVALYILLQVYMRLQGWLKRGKEVQNLPENLARELQKHPKTLIYFYTPTCSACRIMTPIIDRLKNEFDNIIKIDLSRDTHLGPVFGVMGTPTLTLMEGTVIRDFVVGARKENFLRKMLAE